MVQLPPKLRYDHTLLLTSDGRSPVHNYVAGGFFSADERTLTIITGHGRMFEMDIATQKILPKAPALSGRWVSWRGVTYSSDKTKLYLPVGQIATRHRVEGMTNEILVIDAKTLRQIRTITTSRPFWSLTISNDGQHLYAISPDEQCLLVIDTRTYQEVSKISNIGVAPAIAVVAP
jgi:DNA-binding beta-propeller fold protein YncE